MGRKLLITIQAIIGGFYLSGCDDFKSGIVTCDLRSLENMCQQVSYLLPGEDAKSALETECEEELGGISSDEECSLVDSVGSCVAVDPEVLLGDPENGDDTYIVYYDGFEDPEEHCEDHGGRFSPPE